MRPVAVAGRSPILRGTGVRASSEAHLHKLHSRSAPRVLQSASGGGGALSELCDLAQAESWQGSAGSAPKWKRGVEGSRLPFASWKARGDAAGRASAFAWTTASYGPTPRVRRSAPAPSRCKGEGNGSAPFAAAPSRPGLPAEEGAPGARPLRLAPAPPPPLSREALLPGPVAAWGSSESASERGDDETT